MKVCNTHLPCIYIAIVVLIQSQKSLSRPLVVFKTKGEFYEEPLNNLQAGRSRRQVQVQTSCECLPDDEKNWSSHNATLNCEYFHKARRILLYTDSRNSSEEGRWVFEFTEKVWVYMNITYEEIDLNQCLHVIIHSGRYAGGRIVYARNSSSIPTNYNILDIGSANTNAWQSNKPRTDEMDLITNYLAHLVEFSSKNRFGSPSEIIWKGSSSEHSAWVDIFTYDVYKSLNYTVNAELYRNKSLLKSHNSSFSTNETFWFRDWLLPIYEQFGGNTVLNNYFLILSKEISLRKKSLNIGEFVHFWSGAARFDLTRFAQDAFGWSEDYDKLFNVARQEFDRINNLYNRTRKNVPQTTLASTTTSSHHENNTEETTAGNVKQFSAGKENVGENNVTGSTEETKKYNLKDVQARTEDSGQNQLVIGLSTGGAIIFIIFTIMLIFVIYYKKTVQNLRTEMRSLTNKEIKDFFQGDSNTNQNEAQSLIHSIPFVQDFEISRDRLIFDPDNVIGSGEYGCVMKGFIRQLDSVELLPVAIKTVKANVEVPQFKAMLSEAKIMAFLGKHENIVLLCGTHTANIRNREIYIALELCTLGDLRNFLRNNAKEYKHQPFPPVLERNSNEDITSDGGMSTLNLYKWSQEISNGMMYLAQKKVIHGDLAARNVLLTSNRVAKISDFGLSRQLLNYAHYLKTSKTPLPWRWMAVESLKDSEFSVASDVWAFGVTLWEIFSLGETPYPGWTWDYGFVGRLTGGDRLQEPAYADTFTYELMHDCWKLEATERPSFQTIHSILGELVLKHTPARAPDYMELVPLETETDIVLECETELEFVQV